MVTEANVDLIVHDTFFRKQSTGVLIEVGAARPDHLSISASYRSRDWRIVAIEPNPNFCALHRALGYNVLQYACSDEDADNVPFFVADRHGTPYLGEPLSYESFSSLGIKDEYATLLANDQQKEDITISTIPVQVRRLDTILAQHASDVSEIDVLAIDVEGWELSVMRGLNLVKRRPKVVIMENLFYNPGYQLFMRTAGYIFWQHLHPNDVYVREDLRSFIPKHIREYAKEWLARAGLLNAARRVKRVFE